jgi:hypothetical protein
LTEVAGKEEAVWLTRPKGGEELQLRDADVLGFVNYGKVERQVFAVRKLNGQATEYPGIGDVAL